MSCSVEGAAEGTWVKPNATSQRFLKELLSEMLCGHEALSSEVRRELRRSLPN
jgi:hypothetical protein